MLCREDFEHCKHAIPSMVVFALSSVFEQGQLMATNHHLLCALGVGHPSLDAVRACCLSRHCECKLTGAGGGGCAIALISRCSCSLCGGGDAQEYQERQCVEQLMSELR